MTGAMVTPTSFVARLPQYALLTLTLAVSAWWSIYLAAGPYGFSILWLPSGLLFGLLLTSHRKQWASYLVCAFAAFLSANLQRNGMSLLSLILSFSNVLDTWLAARIVTGRVMSIGQLSTINRTLRASSAAILIACTLSAAIAATSRYLLLNQPHSFRTLFETWLASHAISMVIFGALTVVVRLEAPHMLGPPKQRLELAVTLVLIAAATWLVFYRATLPIAIILLPLLLVAVLRHRFSGFVPGMALIALLATTATATGHGPFVSFPGATNPIIHTRVLQLYLLCCCLVSFPVASILSERRQLMKRMVRSELRYRMLAEYSRDLIIRIKSNREFDYISPSVTEILGWEREEFEQNRWALVHPEDIALVKETVAPLYTEGGSASFTYRCQHKQGDYIWLTANMRSVKGEDGQMVLIFSARDVTSRIEAEQALTQQARRDSLTGLANRLLFDERMTLAMARARRNHTRVGLLYCDADHFKSINDTHGHAIGDYVLQIFAQRITQSIRAVDLAIRLGGDEFAILVEEAQSPQSLLFIANKLTAAMQEPIAFGDVSLRISTSIGIAISAPGNPDATALLNLADKALYQAKADGRGIWRLAPEEEG